jgi:hypothetical protein
MEIISNKNNFLNPLTMNLLAFYIKKDPDIHIVKIIFYLKKIVDIYDRTLYFRKKCRLNPSQVIFWSLLRLKMKKQTNLT